VYRRAHWRDRQSDDEIRGHAPAGAPRDDQDDAVACDDAAAELKTSTREDGAQHAPRGGAECHTDADLPGRTRHGDRHGRVQAGSGEDQRHEQNDAEADAENPIATGVSVQHGLQGLTSAGTTAVRRRLDPHRADGDGRRQREAADDRERRMLQQHARAQLPVEPGDRRQRTAARGPRLAAERAGPATLKIAGTMETESQGVRDYLRPVPPPRLP